MKVLIHCLLVSRVAIENSNDILILFFFFLPFWFLILWIKSPFFFPSRGLWDLLFVPSVLKLEDNVAWYESGSLVSFFNLETHCLHFWEIFLNYFFNDFFSSVFSVFSWMYECWMSCTFPLTSYFSLLFSLSVFFLFFLEEFLTIIFHAYVEVFMSALILLNCQEFFCSSSLNVPFL